MSKRGFEFGVVFWLLLSSVCLGQIEIKVEKLKGITGLKKAAVFGETVIYAEDSKPVIGDVALISVTCPAKFVKIKARKSLFEFGSIDKVDANKWLLSTPGKYVVEVSTFDPTLGFEDAHTEVELGEIKPDHPDPDPKPPDPRPDVPGDEFDNLGQRVAALAKDLPKRKEVAKIFSDHATKLETDPSAQIKSVGDSLVKARSELLGADVAKYDSLISELNRDLTKRWPSMDRWILVAWWRAIARGLE